MFHGWDDEKLQTAAGTCVEKAGKLDGVSLLRAMNPHDYYINNYMSMRMIMVKLRMGRSLLANALILSGCLLAAHLQIKMLKM